MSVKINRLEIESVKRVKAVALEPNEKGLTILGGKNNQGKTSVLDAIAWTLGGDRFKPKNAKNDESVIEPQLRIELSNGIIVERKGKNSSLKILDPSGNRKGQILLNAFVEEFALNLPKFLNASSKEKTMILLNIIGVEKELIALERKEDELYQERLVVGRMYEQKDKYAKELVFNEDVPRKLINPNELLESHKKILLTNAENAKKRQRKSELEKEKGYKVFEIEQLRKQLEMKEMELKEIEDNLIIAQQDAMDLADESTSEIEENLAKIEEINRKVRENLDKEKAEEDARNQAEKYAALTSQIQEVRQSRLQLLNNADLPLPELSIENKELVYKGKTWGDMSGAQQLKVATSIVQKLNPNCGFVLMDKLEQMDLDTLEEFGEWLKTQDLQVIATRVSSGDECSIIIEDGYVAENKLEPKKIALDNEEFQPRDWTTGGF